MPVGSKVRFVLVWSSHTPDGRTGRADRRKTDLNLTVRRGPYETGQSRLSGSNMEFVDFDTSFDSYTVHITPVQGRWRLCDVGDQETFGWAWMAVAP